MDCDDDEQIIYWTYIKRPKDDEDEDCERPQKRPRPPDDVYQRLYDELRACYRDAFLVYQDTVLECDRRLGVCSVNPEVVNKVPVKDPVSKETGVVNKVPVKDPVSKETCDPVTSANKAITGSSARYAF